MKDVIEVAEFHRHTWREPDPVSYTFTPSKGYVWAQRAAIWVLHKIGAHRIAHGETFTRRVIDKKDLVDKLFHSHRAVVDQLARQPGTLLIGADEWHRLMAGPEARQLIDFSVRIHFSDRRGPRIIDMRVVVVPWMQGILPVPDSLFQ